MFRIFQVLACKEIVGAHTAIVLQDSIYLNSKKYERPIEDQKLAGERFVQSAGVELKFDNFEIPIDWSQRFGWNDTSSIVSRCMSKYRNLIPNDLPHAKLATCVRSLPGFDDISEPEKETLREIRSQWQSEYEDNLEKVIFDNLSSYEP